MTTISSYFPRASRLLLALFAFSGLALADALITIEPTGADPNLSMSGIALDENGNVQSVIAGVIDITLTQDGNVYDRDTLCVDLFTDIYLGQTYGSVILTPSSVQPTWDTGQNLEEVSWLLDNVLPPPNSAPYSGVLTPADQADLVTTPAQGAGLQFAIWDLTVDNGDGFDAGQVQASTAIGTPADVLAWANTYENLLTLYTPNTSNDANVYYNYQLTNPNILAQMLEGPVFPDNGPPPISTPEPATFVLVGMALVGIGWSGRRRLARKLGSGRA
jgi:hypothetical protein